MRGRTRGRGRTGRGKRGPRLLLFWLFILISAPPDEQSVRAALQENPPARIFPHPFLAVEKTEIAALKASTARIMAMPDEAVARLISDLAPIRLVGCPNCQGGAQDSSVDLWTIDDPDHIRCRHCGERYPSERYPLNGALEIVNPKGLKQTYRYYDVGNEKKRYFFEGVISAEADQYLVERAYEMAILYDAVKEKAYARRAAVILDRFAQVYPGWPVHGNEGNFANWKTFFANPPYPTQSGKWGRWIHDELMTELALAYDLIHDSGSVEDLGASTGIDVRKRIEADLFRAQVELVRRYPRYLGASGQNGTAAGLIAIGRAIEEPDYVHDGVGRFRDCFSEWFFADGMGITGSPAYSKQMLRALESPALMAKGYSDPPGYSHASDRLHFENLDLGEDIPILERSRLALRGLRFPDGRYAPIHDSWARNRFTQELPLPESTPLLLPATGHAVLGRGEGADQTQVHFHFGNHAGHAHADELNLGIFSHGQEMLGEIGYSHTKLRPWAMSTPAHNTVVIDKFNQIITQGWLPVSWARLDRFEKTDFTPREDVFGNLLFFDVEDRTVQVVEAEAVRGYRGLVPDLKEYRRLIALVSVSPAVSYIVDIFRVSGGREHLWTAHGSVNQEQEVQTSLNLRPQDGTLLGPGTAYSAERDPELDSESFKGTVFGLIDGLSSALSDGPWSATWRFKTDPRLGLRMTMMAGPGRRITLGRAPSIIPAGEDNSRVDLFKMPLLLVEDKKYESVFIAVWEPFREQPGISRIHELVFRGDRGRAIGLAVEFVDRTDYILVDPEGDKMRQVKDPDIAFQGSFGLISEVPGGPVSLHLSDGTFLAKGRRTIRGRSRPEGNIVGIRHESGEEFFETDVQLADAGRYIGHWMLVRRPDGRTRAYKILNVKRSGGRSLIRPEGGSGFESPISDETRAGQKKVKMKFREVHFPHKEFAGGLGSFVILDSVRSDG